MCIKRQTFNPKRMSGNPWYCTHENFLEECAMRMLTASFALVSLLIFSALTAARELPSANAERMQLRITKLSTFGANPAGGVSRLAFSESDIEARKYIATLMTEAGLSVRIDTAGNLIGSRGGAVRPCCQSGCRRYQFA